MPDADLGSHRLYYERRGSGEPLLLIQGMGGHHRSWGEPFLGRLDDRFDVVVYDHRGIGTSTDVPGRFTIGDLADDAGALLDVIGWSDAHVMGISLGGMVAQELALRHAEQVRTLVLGCTYAGGEGSLLGAPGPLRMLEAMNTGDAALATRTAYEVNLSQAFRSDEGHFERFAAMALTVNVSVSTVLRQAQAAFLHDASARLAQITAPTLVVHGTADDMIVAANGDHVAGLIAHSRLERLDGVGHLLWWEQPDVVAGLVTAHCLADS